MKDGQNKIKIIKSRLEISRLNLNDLQRYANDDHLQEKVDEQEVIIVEARHQIRLLKQRHDEAPTKIKIVKRDMRYETKQLTKLQKAKEIARLIAVARQLKELTDESD